MLVVTVAPWTLALRAADADASREEARALYVEHGPRIRRFLAGMLGCRHAAADATQETFTRAFASDAWPPARERAPWLFGIARNVAREHRRIELRQARPPSEEATRFASPEESAIAHEARASIESAIASMSEGRRAALLLRVQEGLSCESIAGILEWSVAKVKIEVFRARLALRAELGERDG